MTPEQQLRAWSLEVAAILRQGKSRSMDNGLFELAGEIEEYIRTGKTPPRELTPE
jgi:hypothetical protein